MKSISLLSKFSLPLMVLMLLVSGVDASAEFISTKDYETTCQHLAPGKMWIVDGNMLQIRDQVNENRVIVMSEADTDMLAGRNLVTLNVSLNMDTGSGTAWGKFKSMPTAYPDSAWEGVFSGRIVDGLYTGQGIGLGTGALSGKQLKTKSQESWFGPGDPPEGLCVPPADVGPKLLENDVRILMPHGG